MLIKYNITNANTFYANIYINKNKNKVIVGFIFENYHGLYLTLKQTSVFDFKGRIN